MKTLWLKNKMAEQTIQEKICDALSRIESENQVTILYACETGSRGWGFESIDSDYDVRFIYLRPVVWYLSVEPKRDVIELEIDGQLDICGWDLRKAFHLMRKSNPPLLEWLQSPIIYRQKNSCVDRLRAIMPECYSPVACFHHYLHMAQGNFREYLQGDVVWIKKYFYVLRPVLACIWIERGYGVVTIEFSVLVNRLITESALKQAILKLIEQKRAGDELKRGPKIPEISDYLDREIKRLSETTKLPAKRISPPLIDKVFQECLVEIYGNTI
jgi:predicted nucleotidyltransferase